ncbi:MAG: hypothetical protein HFG41_00150 [Coprococcus sp.]|nr:hypothetical protein [Coprococcus sp.]
MKKEKKSIIIGTAVILVLALAGVIFVWNRIKKQPTPEDIVKEEPTPEDTVEEYFSFLKDKKYEEMYALLDEASQKTYDKEYFVTRNKNIYEGIEAVDIEITIYKDTGEELPPTDGEELSSANEELSTTDGEAVAYAMSMNTVAGKISLENSMSLKKEGSSGYRIAWDSTLIFPGLRDDCKVQVHRENGERGAIFDIHGEPLAATGSVSEVGFIQEKMNPDTRKSDIQKVSEILDISVEYIEGQLSAPYVKADTFVSLKKMDQGDEEKQDRLLEIPGILIVGSVARTYPFGASAGHFTGYIRGITAEELEEREGKGYHENSRIGKSGLERAFEEDLHASAGASIVILGPNGELEDTLVFKNAQSGKDVVTSIDGTLQQAAYEMFSADEAIVAAMNPKNGEIVALVSTPGYEPGEFIYGISEVRREELDNAPGSPLMNRYADTWAVGPVFEPIAEAIGAGGVQPEELGFGEKMPFELSLPVSTYGEKEPFVNPVHLLSMYSMFVNEGSMIQPTVRSTVNEPGEVWKKQVISPETAKSIKAGLIQNVESSGGVESAAKIDRITVFGKAGTMALPSGQRDGNAAGAECDWFVCGTADGTLKPIVIVGMVEDIGDKGGSQYLVEKIRELVEAYSR